MTVPLRSPVLNGEIYELEKKPTALGARRAWKITMLPQASKRVDRGNIVDGEIEGERVITYTDWSGGQSGDLEMRPNTVYTANRLHGLYPGTISFAHYMAPSNFATDEVARPVAVLTFNGKTFVIAGRYALLDNVADRDFGAGVYATDAIVWNNTLYVCFGGTTNFIQSRDTAGTWATDGDVVADHFAIVRNRLWRATATNEVSNIGPGENPFTIGLWSSGITVGDDDYGITDLNAVGEQLVVSKVEGLFIGDEGAVFPNVLSQYITSPDPWNGRNTRVRGSQVIYPTPNVNDLILYDTATDSAGSIGIQHSLPMADIGDNIPSTQVTALATHGPDIWAATEHSGFPRVRPTSVKKTTDNGGSYTTATATNDRDANVLNISSLDTVANGDWVVVGFAPGSIYGMVVEFLAPTTNSNTSALTVSYWNGSAWTAFGVASGQSVWDDTRQPLLATPMVDGVATFARPGKITWNTAPSTVISTIDGVSAHWYRLSVSAALDSSIQFNNIWGVTADSVAAVPGAGLFRGRPARREDAAKTPIVWEPYMTLRGNPLPTAMEVLPIGTNPGRNDRFPSIAIAGKQVTDFLSPPSNAIDEPLSDLVQLSADLDQCYMILPYDDAGTPYVTKYWRNVQFRERGGSSVGTFTISYRTDFASSFTPATAGAIAATGRFLQLMIVGSDGNFTPAAGGLARLEAWPAIHEIEVRYREQPTMKEQHELVLSLPLDGDTAMEKALSNLKALLRTTPFTYLDPTGERSALTVTMEEMGAAELYTTENRTALAVPVRLVEV